VIDQIAEERGVCAPGDLVDHARPADSRLHPLFEWDDQKAAEQFRVSQARHLIAIIRPQYNEAEGPVRAPAFVHVQINGQDGYKRVDRVLDQPELWAMAIDECLGLLRAIQARYDSLVELKPIWEALKRVERERKRKKGRNG